MKFINAMFISGLESDLFRRNIERYGADDTTATYKATRKLLPKFQESINIEFCLPCLPTQPVTKAPIGSQKPPYDEVIKNVIGDSFSASGHNYKACPFRSECMKCRTKSHAYWSTIEPKCPLLA